MAAVDRLLDAARERIAPRMEVTDLGADDVLLVDIRPIEQRRRDGEMPGALVIDRNVLEWRLDPSCPHRLPGIDAATRHVVLVCNEGYASSLAAASLVDLGLHATDLVGGFQEYLRVSPAV